MYCDSTGEALEWAITLTVAEIVLLAVLAVGVTVILFQAHRTLKNGSKKKSNDKHTKPRLGRDTEKKKQKDNWKRRR